MNFLAPLFLVGALAVAGPVLFHLIRRAARERTAFSSVLFLRPVPPRATRRRRLEHILLLLLRCLAVLLLAMAFARPFFPKSDAAPPPADAGHQTVLLLDVSASMRRPGLWDKARAVAAQYLDKAGLGDRVAVLTFDQQVHPVVNFAEWQSWPADQRAALARQKLGAIAPGWGGTVLGQALMEAAEQFQEDNRDTSASRTVTLISDLQEGANLDGLQGHEWPKNVGVQVERVEPSKRGNAGLAMLESSPSGDEHQARLRVANARDSERETFLLNWLDQTNKPTQIYLPPGQTRTIAAPPLPTNALTGALHLDAEDFDDTTWFAAPKTERVNIAYFGTESANDPEQLRYYLERAFSDTGREEVKVELVSSNTGGWHDAAVAVVPAGLPANQSDDLRQWIAGGKTALLVLTNAVAGATLAALTGSPAEIREADGDFALIADVDFNHPLLAPFADPRYSDFSHIHFWKHRQWTVSTNLDASVLAKFDDGSPALAQVKIGKGNLLVFTSGWQPADSQLALSTKFVPLLQNMLDWSGGAAPGRAQFQIGEAIPAPASPGGAVHWTKPDGQAVELPGGKPFTETDAPGIYTATLGDKTNYFAVNLAFDECRTAPMSSDDLGRLGVPLQSAARHDVAMTPGRQRLLLRAELENRQKIWRWMIAGLLGVALVEIVLGGWLARRVPKLELA